MGGAIIKFPQIIKVFSMKSVVGISFTSVVLEVFYWSNLQLSTNILASGYCIYKGNPFSLYGENVFIGIQMLIIIGLFVLYGKGTKAVYLGFFGLMIVAAYYISDPHHLPSFIVEHSIIVQTLLSNFLSLFSLYFQNDSNPWSIQTEINGKFGFDDMGFITFGQYSQNYHNLCLSITRLQVSFVNGFGCYTQRYNSLSILLVQELKA